MITLSYGVAALIIGGVVFTSFICGGMIGSIIGVGLVPEQDRPGPLVGLSKSPRKS